MKPLLRLAFVILHTALALEQNRSIASDLTGPEIIEQIRFDGCSKFEPWQIQLGLLANRQLDDQLNGVTTIEAKEQLIAERVLYGYRRAGFLHAKVEWKMDRSESLLTLVIDEGVLTKLSAIDIVGLDDDLAIALRKWLTEATAESDEEWAPRLNGIAMDVRPSKAEWTKQSTPPTDSPNLTIGRYCSEDRLVGLRSCIDRFLESRGFSQSQFKVSFRYSENQKEQTLLCEFEQLGNLITVDQIEYRGIQKNDADKLTSYLGIVKGMQWTHAEQLRIQAMLFRSARFQWHDVSWSSSFLEPTKVTIYVTVVESEKLPPVGTELEPDVNRIVQTVDQLFAHPCLVGELVELSEHNRETKLASFGICNGSLLVRIGDYIDTIPGIQLGITGNNDATKKDKTRLNISFKITSESLVAKGLNSDRMLVAPFAILEAALEGNQSWSKEYGSDVWASEKLSLRVKSGTVVPESLTLFFWEENTKRALLKIRPIASDQAGRTMAELALGADQRCSNLIIDSLREFAKRTRIATKGECSNEFVCSQYPGKETLLLAAANGIEHLYGVDSFPFRTVKALIADRSSSKRNRGSIMAMDRNLISSEPHVCLNAFLCWLAGEDRQDFAKALAQQTTAILNQHGVMVEVENLLQKQQFVSELRAMGSCNPVDAASSSRVDG